MWPFTKKKNSESKNRYKIIEQKDHAGNIFYTAELSISIEDWDFYHDTIYFRLIGKKFSSINEAESYVNLIEQEVKNHMYRKVVKEI